MMRMIRSIPHIRIGVLVLDAGFAQVLVPDA
jgi:hypothetical protein